MLRIKERVEVTKYYDQNIHFNKFQRKTNKTILSIVINRDLSCLLHLMQQEMTDDLEIRNMLSTKQKHMTGGVNEDKRST